MFGYVQADPKQLSQEDIKLYRSYYCGICCSLKKQFGQVSRLTLNYDMVFMVMLLADLLDPETHVDHRRCGVHPAKRKMIAHNRIIDYGAAMNVLLAYYNLLDDWQDEGNRKAKVGANALAKHMHHVRKMYPRQSRAVEEGLKALQKEELMAPHDLDTAANIFGTMLGELFVYQKDHWSEDCRTLGTYLGRFIYWMDAYHDLKGDLKKGRYNPFALICGEENFEDRVKEMLEGALGECALVLERLPLVEHLPVLRNILYAGVKRTFPAGGAQTLDK